MRGGGQSCLTKDCLFQILFGETLVGPPHFQSHGTIALHASSPPWLPSVHLLTRKPRRVIPQEHIWNIMFKNTSSQCCVSYSGLCRLLLCRTPCSLPPPAAFRITAAHGGQHRQTTLIISLRGTCMTPNIPISWGLWISHQKNNTKRDKRPSRGDK